jgi:hypothetical protein
VFEKSLVLVKGIGSTNMIGQETDDLREIMLRCNNSANTDK